MATRRPRILPLRDKLEPRPAPFDLLPLADPDPRVTWPQALVAVAIGLGWALIFTFAPIGG